MEEVTEAIEQSLQLFCDWSVQEEADATVCVSFSTNGVL